MNIVVFNFISVTTVINRSRRGVDNFVMGKSVAWEAETSTVVISDSSTTVRLSIGSDIMYQSVTDEANGGSFSFEVPLDTPPMIINDRTCLPVRAVAEAFMATVDWDASTGTVMIITADLLC